MRGGGLGAILVGAGVLAAGCGTTTAGSYDVTAAVSRTSAQTARIAVTTTSQMAGMSISFTETGVFDFAHSRGTVSMQAPVGITEVFLPPRAYLKMPGGGGGLPAGKSWIAVDTGTVDAPGAGIGGPFSGADPADLLAALTAISGNVRKIGTGTVRGVPVTEFSLRIDPAKAAARVPAWERPGFVQFSKALGVAAIPVYLWADGQNLVRRVQLSLHLPGDLGPAGAGAPKDTRLVQTTDFYDFGVPVRVTAPPAAEVASMPQLAAGKSSSSTIVPPGAPPASGPPPVSGSLSPAQAAAAKQAVTAFWAALGGGDPAVVARTVLPSQRSCVSSSLDGAPKITVRSLRILSARPAGGGRATVRFTVDAKVSLGGHDFPVTPGATAAAQWVVAAQSGGHWYVDLSASSALAFAGPC